jgi:hypothetical protein
MALSKTHPVSVRVSIFITSIATSIVLSAGAFLLKSESADSKERNNVQDIRLNAHDVKMSEMATKIDFIYNWVLEQINKEKK